MAPGVLLRGGGRMKAFGAIVAALVVAVAVFVMLGNRVPHHTDFISQGVPVQVAGVLYNADKLDQFFAGETAAKDIKAVSYTVEGDPVFMDITRANGRYRLRVDSRKDKYGHGAVVEHAYEKFKTEAEGGFIRYILYNGDKPENADSEQAWQIFGGTAR